MLVAKREWHHGLEKESAPEKNKCISASETLVIRIDSVWGDRVLGKHWYFVASRVITGTKGISYSFGTTLVL
jgi:hypothetical protein